MPPTNSQLPLRLTGFMKAHNSKAKSINGDFFIEED
jgi:hypothetical protein